jgi:hypothetical protein
VRQQGQKNYQLRGGKRLLVTPLTEDGQGIMLYKFSQRPLRSNMKEDFIKATERWYRYVNQDHHKDRDCHFEVGRSKTYSYGGEPSGEEWFCRQEGYINEFCEIGSSEDEVMQKTIKAIDEFISKNVVE